MLFDIFYVWHATGPQPADAEALAGLGPDPGEARTAQGAARTTQSLGPPRLKDAEGILIKYKLGGSGIYVLAGNFYGYLIPNPIGNFFLVKVIYFVPSCQRRRGGGLNS